MASRVAFDGRQQRRALEALQEHATAGGRSVTVIAGELGLSDGQYRRYLWGKVPLRTDQLGAFATALGTSRRDLIEALGLLDDPDAVELRERAEAAAGPDEPEIAGELPARLKGKSKAFQDQAFALTERILSERKE